MQTGKKILGMGRTRRTGRKGSWRQGEPGKNTREQRKGEGPERHGGRRGARCAGGRAREGVETWTVDPEFGEADRDLEEGCSGSASSH